MCLKPSSGRFDFAAVGGGEEEEESSVEEEEEEEEDAGTGREGRAAVEEAR